MAVDALPVIVILFDQYRWLLSFRAVVVVDNLGIPSLARGSTLPTMIKEKVGIRARLQIRKR